MAPPDTHLSVLDVFKKRLDNWQPVYVTPFGIQYQLDQLFNHYLTLTDLKSSIHTLKDMTYLLTHPKLSVANRYILFHALVAVFPGTSVLPEPFCDDKFLELLIKNLYDLNTILNLITDLPGKDYVTEFLQWINAKSPYLQSIINNAKAPVTPSFRLMSAQQIPVAPTSRPINMSESQIEQRKNSPNTLLSTFIKRIHGMSREGLSSHTIFQSKLFDNELSVAQLKENIQNLDDLLDIFKKGHLQPKACYSLFNYLISVFPLPKNNGNLSACACDEKFLQKIMKSQQDLNIIYSFIAPYKSRNLVQTLEKRLAHSPHYTRILQARVVPKNGDGLNRFFRPNVQLNTPPKPILVNLVTGEESMEMSTAVATAPHSSPIQSMLKRKLSDALTLPDNLEKPVYLRASKRQKENSQANSLNLNVKQVEPAAKERANMTHPLGQLINFFAHKENSPVIAQEPEGGEYELSWLEPN
ncbi:TPA: hypothetical protein ACTXXA_002703 [Legionella anisa]